MQQVNLSDPDTFDVLVRTVTAEGIPEGSLPHLFCQYMKHPQLLVSCYEALIDGHICH